MADYTSRKDINENLTWSGDKIGSCKKIRIQNWNFLKFFMLLAGLKWVFLLEFKKTIPFCLWDPDWKIVSDINFTVLSPVFRVFLPKIESKQGIEMRYRGMQPIKPCNHCGICFENSLVAQLLSLLPSAYRVWQMTHSFSPALTIKHLSTNTS